MKDTGMLGKISGKSTEGENVLLMTRSPHVEELLVNFLMNWGTSFSWSQHLEIKIV